MPKTWNTQLPPDVPDQTTTTHLARSLNMLKKAVAELRTELGKTDTPDAPNQTSPPSPEA